MTGNDLTAVIAFYQNVWNYLRQVGLQSTTIVPHYNFYNAIRFDDETRKERISVKISSLNPLMFLRWPRRLHVSKDLDEKGGLDIFLAINQTIGKDETDGDFNFVILNSHIRLFYCKAQTGYSGHNMERYTPDLSTCIRYDYDSEDMPFHPLFHMHFDKGDDLFGSGHGGSTWRDNIIAQIRIPTSPKDILGVIWGLFADHYPAKMMEYKHKVERGLSNKKSNIPQMASHTILQRIHEGADNPMYTSHWFPEWDR